MASQNNKASGVAAQCNIWGDKVYITFSVFVSEDEISPPSSVTINYTIHLLVEKEGEVWYE